MSSIKSFDQVLDLAKERCKSGLSEIAYSLWIQEIEAVSFDNTTFVLKVKSEFKKNVLEEKYLDLLTKTFTEIMGFDVVISIIFEDFSSIRKNDEHLKEKQLNMEEEYTFDNFIVGSSNKFAHAACQAVAANPANAYNPLFIYGSSGLGKTHLLYAICNEIGKNMPERNLIFVKGEEFTNELIDAIFRENTRKFHDKYRLADILLVDDIQFIGGKESTQEEFFHTFNALYQDGKQIILTSDRPPKEIKTLEDRLRTRFEWGLIADIQPPDFETRNAIILRKAKQLEFNIPPEVCDYLANHLKTNIRQLEGAVKKLNAYRLLEDQEPSLIGAQNAIRDILNSDQPVPVTIEKIINEVSRTYGVSPEDIRSSKRSADISNARQIAMFVVREITQISMAAVGEEFGNRDHSTVVYALQQVEKKISNDFSYKEAVENIIENIRTN